LIDLLSTIINLLSNLWLYINGKHWVAYLAISVYDSIRSSPSSCKVTYLW
jgi:hypothetical protein